MKPKVGYWILWRYVSSYDKHTELIYGQITRIDGERLTCDKWWNATYKEAEGNGYILTKRSIKIYKTKEELMPDIVLEAL